MAGMRGAVVSTALMTAAVAGLAFGALDVGGSTTAAGRVGRVDPGVPGDGLIALDTLAEIHTQSVNERWRCTDERRGEIARAGGPAHMPVFC